MADFKTHITVSTTLGIGYAAVAYRHFDVPAPACVLAGALCSVSGMLPDLDSDSGVPLRESLAFAAACVPAMLIPRWEGMGWPNEAIILAGALVYAAVRFGLGTALKKYTVHRGMFHSIPAALIAGEVAFLLCVTGDIYLRAYKAGAVLLGFFSHLILDEIYSVKVSGGRIGLKSSSGTAMKLWGDSVWANLSCYVKLILLGVLVLNDPIWKTLSPEAERLHAAAAQVVQQVESRTNLQLPRGSATGTGRQTAPQQGTAQQGSPHWQPQATPGQAPTYSSGYAAPPQYYPPQQQPYYPQQQPPQQPWTGPQQPYYGQPAAPNYAPQQQYAPPQSYPPQSYAPPGYVPAPVQPPAIYQQPPAWQTPPAAGAPIDPRVQYGPMTKRY